MHRDIFKKGILTIDKEVLKHKNMDMKDTILITGTPRSGTTWLMEILGTIPGYRTLFEPLNPYWFPASIQAGFQSRMYIPYDKNWMQGEDYLRSVFSGGMYHPLISYPLKPYMFMNALYANKLIVKCVRLNRMLPWVSERFSLNKILLIIRHPCAVVASQLKTGYTGYHSSTPPYKKILPSKKMIENEIKKTDGFGMNTGRILKRIQKPEELLSFIWCLDTMIPLLSSKSKTYDIVSYEHMVWNGMEGIIRLFRDIGEKKIPKSALKQVRTPSMLTKNDDKHMVSDVQKQLSKWTTSLTEKKIQNILNIVSAFNLDFYTRDILPDEDTFNASYKPLNGHKSMLPTTKEK